MTNSEDRLCTLDRQEDGGYRPVEGNGTSDPELRPGIGVRLLSFRNADLAAAYREGYRDGGGPALLHQGDGRLDALIAVTEPGAGVQIEDRGGLADLRACLRWGDLLQLASSDSGPRIDVTIRPDGSPPRCNVEGREFRITGTPEDARVEVSHDAPTHLLKPRVWYDEHTRNETILVERDHLVWETDLSSLLGKGAVFAALARNIDTAESEHRTDALAEKIRADPVHQRYAALMRDGWALYKPTDDLSGGAMLLPPEGTNAPSREINASLLARLIRARLVDYPIEIRKRLTCGLRIGHLSYRFVPGDCAGPLAAYDAKPRGRRRKEGRKEPETRIG